MTSNNQLPMSTTLTPAISYPAVLLHEPAEQYHARAGEFLSSHQLSDYRKCPELYHRKRLGLVADEDRPAYVVGRAAHTVILEGLGTFQAGYAVGGPINPKTGLPFGSQTKAFAEWAAEQGKTVLTNEQYTLIMRMATSVKRHTLAQDLLSEGIAEGVLRADYGGLPCQIRLDWLNPQQGIVDLKTVDDLTWFEADAKRFGYVHQVAFYQAVLAERIGLHLPVFFLAVEKKDPQRCGLWQVTENALAVARQENLAAIERLKSCTAQNHWPTHYEALRYFELN